jgi:hypothetical protein
MGVAVRKKVYEDIKVKIKRIGEIRDFFCKEVLKIENVIN